MPASAAPPPPHVPADDLAQILDEAHRILTNWGWRPGPCDTRGPRSPRRPMRIAHAVWAACTGDADPDAPKLLEAGRAHDALLALTGQLECPPNQRALAEWNDEPGRTLDEVLVLLRHTAEHLPQPPGVLPGRLCPAARPHGDRRRQRAPARTGFPRSTAGSRHTARAARTSTSAYGGTPVSACPAETLTRRCPTRPQRGPIRQLTHGSQELAKTGGRPGKQQHRFVDTDGVSESVVSRDGAAGGRARHDQEGVVHSMWTEGRLTAWPDGPVARASSHHKRKWRRPRIQVRTTPGGEQAPCGAGVGTVVRTVADMGQGYPCIQNSRHHICSSGENHIAIEPNCDLRDRASRPLTPVGASLPMVEHVQPLNRGGSMT
ncbi:DUF6197 family protein [Streptomyces sp. NPDC001073]